MNAARFTWPEAYVDRRGRLLGNMLALRDLATGLGLEAEITTGSAERPPTVANREIAYRSRSDRLRRGRSCDRARRLSAGAGAFREPGA